MKKVITLFLILLITPCFASEFGEYKYNKYLGIQQQLRNQQMAAYRNQMQYQNNPTRNIRYPNTYGAYPNITPRRQVNNSYSRNYYRYSY